jgi:hypothetical protein
VRNLQQAGCHQIEDWLLSLYFGQKPDSTATPLSSPLRIPAWHKALPALRTANIHFINRSFFTDENVFEPSSLQMFK